MIRPIRTGAFALFLAAAGGLHAEETATPPPPPAAAPAVPADTTPAPAAEVKKAKPDANDISSDEVTALLTQLKAMRNSLDSEEKRLIGEALKALGPASTSGTEAISLWVAANRAEMDKQNKKPADFEQWRKDNDALIHDVQFGNALRLQCRYLKLCLEMDKDAPEKAFPATLAMLGDAIKAVPAAGKNVQYMKEDIFSSKIARKLGVDKFAPEKLPHGLLDIEGQFKLPISTAVTSDPSQVGPLWEARIKMERSFADAMDQNSKVTQRKTKAGDQPTAPGRRGGDRDKDVQESHYLEDFENLQEPRLRWAMGEDFFKAGLRRRAFEILFGVIHKYPKHENVSEWVDRITSMAESMSGEEKAAADKKSSDTKSSDTRSTGGGRQSKRAKL